MASSEGWRRWAQTHATFHRYSLNKYMLVAMQGRRRRRSEFRTWQSLGRQVRKGERSPGFKVEREALEHAGSRARAGSRSRGHYGEYGREAAEVRG